MQGEINPIYEGLIPIDLAWSTDNQSLIFFVPADTEWKVYSISENKLLTTQEWLLQPTFTENDASIFNLAEDNLGQESKAFLSPNREYVVFASPSENPYNPFILTIGNIETKEIFYSERDVLEPFPNANGFDVLWSNDSQSFVLKRIGPSGSFLFSYVSNYINNLSNMITISLNFLEIEEELYVLDDIYDISNDGKYLLSWVWHEAENSQNRKQYSLALWDINNPENSYLITEDKITEARFCETSDEFIILLNENIVKQYNRETQEITTLVELNSSLELVDAVLSGNNRAIAIVEKETPDSTIASIYIFSLSEETIATSACFNQEF